MNRLRAPLAATRSSTATVASGRMMLMRLLTLEAYTPEMCMSNTTWSRVRMILRLILRIMQTSSLLLHPQKRHAHRKRHVELISGWRQLPRFAVDPEHDHACRILIRREEIRSGRVDREIARVLPPGRNILHRRQRSLGGIDRKHRDTVGTAAIGGVQKLSARIDRDLRRTLRPREVLGQH